MPKPVEEVLLDDMKANAAAFLRSLGALSYLKKIPGLLLEKAEAGLAEWVRIAELAESLSGIGGIQRRRIDYSQVKEAREAVALDLALFGESRTIDEVQESVYANGFPKGRTGQVRSSINARGNLSVFFAVDGEDKVRLLPRGQELARELRARYGIT